MLSISLTKQIQNALDNSKFACDVFIDLLKAFDTVNHKILLCKLEYYGISGLSSFVLVSKLLKNRCQFTEMNGVKSDFVEKNL